MPTNTIKLPHQCGTAPFLAQNFVVFGKGEEVCEIDHTILVDPFCLEDVGRGSIVLFGDRAAFWTDTPMAASSFAGVEKVGKDGRGVEFGPAHEVYTAILSHQGTRAHVSNESIVFDLEGVYSFRHFAHD